MLYVKRLMGHYTSSAGLVWSTPDAVLMFRETGELISVDPTNGNIVQTSTRVFDGKRPVSLQATSTGVARVVSLRTSLVSGASGKVDVLEIQGLSVSKRSELPTSSMGSIQRAWLGKDGGSVFLHTLVEGLPRVMIWDVDAGMLRADLPAFAATDEHFVLLNPILWSSGTRLILGRAEIDRRWRDLLLEVLSAEEYFPPANQDWAHLLPTCRLVEMVV